VYEQRASVLLISGFPDDADLVPQNVYLNGTDNSLPSMLSVMPNVIEKNQRTVVMHGGADYVLIQEGTRYSIYRLPFRVSSQLRLN
jgi:hypothetical protein